MFKLLRLFLIISLTSIVVTTALLTLLYRHVTIRTTDNLAQASNLALAQAALVSVRPELDDYLATAARAGPQEFSAQRLAARLTEVVKELRRDSPGPVIRVILFDRRGVVIFSTDREQIGQNHVTSAGFISAINGRVASNLVYRDIFSRVGWETEAATGRPFHPVEAANLMETYVPVRASATKSVDAVFESYIDVSPLVTQNQNAAFIVLAGAGLVLLLLYGVLILLARRTLKAIVSQQHLVVGRRLEAIKSQQHSIGERTAALKMLSAKMLSGDEMEKKKLAFGLREGLAQTLITIKMRIERKLDQFAARKAHDESLASIIPLLQSAIDDVQTIATGLRPSSLDELGLLPTIDWFCREFERLHPAIVVAEEISVQENNVPAPLKIVIYRIIESAFTNIARYESTDQIGLALQLEDGAITLTIDDTSQDSRYAATAERDTDSDLQVRFGEAQERTTLSGGSFTIARSKAGGVTLRASWTV
jgi:signal transduction histidine kinase